MRKARLARVLHLHHVVIPVRRRLVHRVESQGSGHLRNGPARVKREEARRPVDRPLVVNATDLALCEPECVPVDWLEWHRMASIPPEVLCAAEDARQQRLVQLLQVREEC